MKKDKSFLTRTLINAASIYITAGFIKGMDINGFGAAIVAAIVLGIVNALIRPVLIILSLPINIFTLGIFTFIINGVMLLIVSSVTVGFYIQSLGVAIVASLVISAISALISLILN